MRMKRCVEATVASSLVMAFDLTTLEVTLSNGVSLGGALGGVGVATVIGLEIVRRLFGHDGGGDGPFLPLIPFRPLTS
jgi:hypothetical protein